MLSKELLSELKIILKEEFNLELSDKELLKFGSSLVNYFDLLSRADYKNKVKNEQK